MNDQKIYYLIAQRTLNGRYVNCWINGSDRKEMIKNEIFFDLLSNNDLYDLIPEVKESILLTYSLYIVNFMSKKISLLSATLAEKEQDVMGVISKAPSIVDSEVDSKKKVIHSDSILNIGRGLSAFSKPEDKKGQPNISGKKQRTGDSMMASFQKFLSNFVK